MVRELTVQSWRIVKSKVRYLNLIQSSPTFATLLTLLPKLSHFPPLTNQAKAHQESRPSTTVNPNICCTSAKKRTCQVPLHTPQRNCVQTINTHPTPGSVPNLIGPPPISPGGLSLTPESVACIKEVHAVCFTAMVLIRLDFDSWISN